MRFRTSGSSIPFKIRLAVAELCRAMEGSITGKDSTLLPTPTASDGDVGYCDHRALLNYRKSGHQLRLIYESQAAGLTDSEILILYAEIMSFPISSAKLRRSETQLCLL
jgi:hypothetical protein